jgi:MoaA/NifB/PqqE/SkfB family radical SAM enzyme
MNQESPRGNPFHPSKVSLHQEKLNLLARGNLVPPVTVEVDLTSDGCNQACIECSFGSSFKRTQINIQTTPLLKTLAEISDLGTKGIEVVGGGEPTAHPQVLLIMQEMVALGFDVGLITNGVLAHKILPIAESLRYVRFSLDSANSATYDIIHGVQGRGHHENVLTNIGNVRQKMTGLQHADQALGIAYLVVPPYNHTHQEIMEATKLSIDLGADYLVFRPAQIKSTQLPSSWQEAYNAVQEMKALYSNTIRIYSAPKLRWQIATEHRRTPGLCPSRPLVAVIEANGDIAHCILYRGQRDLRVGTIYDLEKTFSDQWFSPENQLRLRNFNTQNCPLPCKHDQYNDLIMLGNDARAVNPLEIAHPNHI